MLESTMQYTCGKDPTIYEIIFVYIPHCFVHIILKNEMHYINRITIITSHKYLTGLIYIISFNITLRVLICSQSQNNDSRFLSKILFCLTKGHKMNKMRKV